MTQAGVRWTRFACLAHDVRLRDTRRASDTSDPVIRARSATDMDTKTILSPGTEAPDFKLRGPGGASYMLSEHRGECPVLLVFFPFAFSPVCAHQLPDVQKAMPRLTEAGVAVYGISVDSYHANAAFARSLGLSFPLLSDWNRDASRAYGSLFVPGNFAWRASFLIDKQGRIAWSDIAEDLDAIDQIPSVERALSVLAGV
jgi:peroxiredoxin